MAAVYLSTEDAECYASVCGAAGDGGRAAGCGLAWTDLIEALRVAEQAVGNLLEKNEEVIAMGTYMGQCVQSLLWQAVKRELDHELAATGSTATCSVYSSNKMDKLL